MSVEKLAEYRAKAEECRQAVTASVSDDDKALFLKLAEEWLKLAQKLEAAPRADAERRDEWASP